MVYKKILLKDEYPILGDSEAILEVFCYDPGNEYEKDFKRYPLLTLPGGGYEYCSLREKDPVAFAYLAQGYNCFALTYTCKRKYPTPQLEVAVAMDYIQKHAVEYRLHPEIKSVIGFSAGGHLAASYCRYYEELAGQLNLKAEDIKPSFAILCYPVINCLDFSHPGTKATITGGDPELMEKLSIEKHITKDYPACYIWTTEDDQAVPSQNSKALYAALQQKGVTSLFHCFLHGPHGRSVATNETELGYQKLEDYLYEMQDWVKESFKFFMDNVVNK